LVDPLVDLPAWLLVAGPLVLLLAGLLPARTASRHAAWVQIAATAGTTLSLAAAAAAAVLLASRGGIATRTLGGAGLGFSLYFDALSLTVFALVAFVGALVVRFSRHYLDGDPRQGEFTARLALTLGSVLLLIAAGNLLQFAIAWVATSLGLNRLLLFYRDRPAAVLAARKKFVASRLADLCLGFALVLLYRSLGSLDYATLFAAIDARIVPMSVMTPVALLLGCAALLKSAQFPLHGWLLEVMETPTPVSALLHAGVINAGGFLLLRFADLVTSVPVAQGLLVCVAGFTALFASVVMLTQTSVKLSLAWSTIAQMGFLLLQCGLGAWASAVLHIVAHSLYKAHAFLSSGSVLDLARASWSPSPGGGPHRARLLIALPLALGVTAWIAAQFDALLPQRPGAFVLAAVMVMGITHLMANAIDERSNPYVVVRTVATAALVAAVWFALHAGAEHVLAAVLPATQPLGGPLQALLPALVILSFAALTLFQAGLADRQLSPRWRNWYVHVANGFYVNTVANRLALRLWPT
jgi:NAD(P)H-quinone oxidoreductase subunit 5